MRVPAFVTALVVAAALSPLAGPPAAAETGPRSPGTTPISRLEAAGRPVLRTGDSGPWVEALHRALSSAPAARPFDARTARAVVAFRRSVAMRPRPVVSVRTWVRLGTRVVAPAEPRPNLSYGDSSPWVAALQRALGVTPASGWFGPLTRAAVRAFQTSAGLPVTGTVDAATWRVLGSRVVAPVTDVTTTEAARTSETYRRAVGVQRFVTSWTARLVVQRESGGQCDIVSPSGTYRGKWQMDADFWAAYGGLAYAPRPDLATCGQQDRVAFRGWVDRWWQPWPTAIP